MRESIRIDVKSRSLRRIRNPHDEFFQFMGHPKALLQAGVGGAVESRTMFDVLFKSVLSKYTTIQNSKKAPLCVR